MKTEFPPVDLGARKRLDLRSIKAPEGDDANVEANSRKLAEEWGAVTRIAPAKGPVASLRLEVPLYLDQQLAERAFRGVDGKRVTKQYIVLQALKNAGFHVEPDDLVPDKRRRR
jgi:hypothetical protein